MRTYLDPGPDQVLAGKRVRTSTTVAGVGAYHLALATVLPDRGVELHSFYTGHDRLGATSVTHLLLAPRARAADNAVPERRDPGHVGPPALPLRPPAMDYSYDQTGRLTLVKDTKSGACTTRSYEYTDSAGKDSNRTKLTTRPSSTATCDTTSAGTVVNYGYDEADRESDTGFSYDAFGRTTAIPAAQGGSATTATYFTNDRLASLAQGTTTRSYALDPAYRVRSRSASDTATQTYHYADDSDSPSWTQDSLSANPPYTRNVVGVDGNLAALVTSGTVRLQFPNLHGDVVATGTTSTSATGPASTMESDEFGVPRAPASYRYGWLGGKERRTELSTGATAMG